MPIFEVLFERKVRIVESARAQIEAASAEEAKAVGEVILEAGENLSWCEQNRADIEVLDEFVASAEELVEGTEPLNP